MKPFLLARVGVLLLAILGGACTSTPSNVLKIGAAGPMTGDQSKMGMDLRHGVELAVEEWNARGGVLGKTIVLQVEDDQHDPKQAVAVANKFVHSGVVGVIGHWNSSASIPASGVYHQAKIVMITPASTNPRLTEHLGGRGRTQPLRSTPARDHDEFVRRRPRILGESVRDAHWRAMGAACARGDPARPRTVG